MKKLSAVFGLLALMGYICLADSASSLTQWGITWTFDKAYETGQYVNGDYWVVGPVTITGITKPHGTNGHDGSMINPIPGGGHGYDQQISGYQSSLDVSRSLPVVLQPGKSLVSTVTWVPGDAGCPDVNTTANAPRPTGRKASVLTCVAAAPAADAFRPPCVGNWKPDYTRSQVRTDLLPGYAPVPAMPSLATVERYVERVWLNHNPEWIGSYLIPQENMQHYGREISHEINNALLRLMIDDGNRETLMNRLIQVGLDLYGALKAGQYWGTVGGGWGHGRKMPILLAGILLDVEEMKNIGSTYQEEKFQEDCQTFYVTSADKAAFPSLFSTIGEAVWSQRHCNRPNTDADKRGYEICCTAYTWPGASLVAMMMNDVNGVNGRTLWKSEAFFDYVDRWVNDGGYNGDTFISSFQMGAWMRYRTQLPAVASVADLFTRSNNPGINVIVEPNPMTDHITVTVETSRRDVSASMSIFDQSGNIINTVTGPGNGLSLQWDGDTMSGSNAKPGMYFYRITAGDRSASGRIIKTN